MAVPRPTTDAASATSARPRRILISAGEASGDRSGALLIAELKGRDPTLEFRGLGGHLMREAGVSLIRDCTGMAVMGFVETWKKVPRGLEAFFALGRTIRSGWPDLVIAIDFPTLNLRLARYAWAFGVPVLWYFPPGAWTQDYRSSRVVAACATKILTPFPASVARYAAAGADVVCIGHPLVDVLGPAAERRRERLADGTLPPTVALLPGSRDLEITHILPIMLEACALIKAELPAAEFVVSRAPTIAEDRIRALAARVQTPVEVVGGTAAALERARAVLVTSGTATLEAAIVGVPMVVVYRANSLQYMQYRIFVEPKRPDPIGMPNILAGEMIVPELIQSAATPRAMADLILRYLRDADHAARTEERLRQATAGLGKGGALARSADIILEMLAQTAARPRRDP